VIHSNAKPGRILVIRLSSLGDVVLTTPLLRRLRALPRRYIIDMLTRERYLPLLDCIDDVDNRLVYPDDSAAVKTLKRQLAGNHYDAVIDLQNNIVSRSIVAAINPAGVYRFRRARVNRWLRIHLPARRGKLKTPPPVAEGYLATAKPLQVIDDGLGLELNVDAVSAQAMRKLLRVYHAEANLPVDIVPLIFAPGARHNSKMWLPERWVELMRRAYAAGFESQVLIGGADEAGLIESLQSQLDFPVLTTAGSINLKELTALVSLGRVLVSNDSGPMHVAAAVGTPVVVIFGSTVPELGFAPFRCPAEIVQIDGLECRPCHPHGRKRCPRKHFRCMKEIDSEMVMKALLRASGVEWSVPAAEIQR